MDDLYQRVAKPLRSGINAIREEMRNSRLETEHYKNLVGTEKLEYTDEVLKAFSDSLDSAKNLENKLKSMEKEVSELKKKVKYYEDLFQQKEKTISKLIEEKKQLVIKNNQEKKARVIDAARSVQNQVQTDSQKIYSEMTENLLLLQKMECEDKIKSTWVDTPTNVANQEEPFFGKNTEYK